MEIIIKRIQKQEPERENRNRQRKGIKEKEIARKVDVNGSLQKDAIIEGERERERQRERERE